MGLRNGEKHCKAFDECEDLLMISICTSLVTDLMVRHYETNIKMAIIK